MRAIGRQDSNNGDPTNSLKASSKMFPSWGKTSSNRATCQCWQSFSRQLLQTSSARKWKVFSWMVANEWLDFICSPKSLTRSFQTTHWRMSLIGWFQALEMAQTITATTWTTSRVVVTTLNTRLEFTSSQSWPTCSTSSRKPRAKKKPLDCSMLCNGSLLAETSHLCNSWIFLKSFALEMDRAQTFWSAHGAML